MKEQKDQRESEKEDRKEQEKNEKAEADIVLSLNQQEELRRVPLCEGDWG